MMSSVRCCCTAAIATLIAMGFLAGLGCEASEAMGTGDSGGSADGDAAGELTDDDSGSEGQPVDPGPHSLVEPSGWSLDTDPPAALAADRPESVQCDVGWGLEDGVFEVDTELCNWGAFVQPSAVEIRQGDTVEIIILHDTLFSEDAGAVAHLALGLGDAVAWETAVMIPAPAGFLRPSIEADRDLPVGTPLHFHAHNHGYNNYRVVDIQVTHR